MVKENKDENRLYFIIRSMLMSIISGIIFISSVWILNLVNSIQIIVLSIFTFTFALIISRIFDSYIEKAVKKILKFLSRHSKLKNFILKYF